MNLLNYGLLHGTLKRPKRILKGTLHLGWTPSNATVHFHARPAYV